MKKLEIVYKPGLYKTEGIKNGITVEGPEDKKCLQKLLDRVVNGDQFYLKFTEYSEYKKG